MAPPAYMVQLCLLATISLVCGPVLVLSCVELQEMRQMRYAEHCSARGESNSMEAVRIYLRPFLETIRQGETMVCQRIWCTELVSTSTRRGYTRTEGKAIVIQPQLRYDD